MPLYSKIETDTSSAYLAKIATALDAPPCLLGGWAVYLTVNDAFSREQGRDYLGSRDIDLGFDVPASLPAARLKTESIGRCLATLSDLGFQNVGFRYCKQFQYETGEELSEEEARTTPAHDIFTLYIDPVVNEIHPAFKKTFGFTPVDEPLLSLVFPQQKYRREVTAFDVRLLIPSPEALIAMKVNCLPRRTKDEKLVKDLCDIYALLWYSGEPFQTVKKETWEIVREETRKTLRSFLGKDHSVIQRASVAMGINETTINRLLDSFVG